MSKKLRGLFVVGTDTGIGKTYCAALIAQALRRTGRKVGVYKPAASGCRKEGKTLVSDDALALWEAAGRPLRLADVCPQRLLAPLAPHLAARAEGKEINRRKLRTGLEVWCDNSDIVIVEGAGGLMSPLGDDEYVLDLAVEFGFPLVVVTANRLGTINQTLLTLIAAATHADAIPIAGLIVNHPLPPTGDDPSTASNVAELQARAVPPVLTQVAHGAAKFSTKVDWWKLAAR